MLVRVGDTVTFRNLQGVTREGRIVVAEHVGPRDRNGRAPGPWVKIRIAGDLFDWEEIPLANVGAVLSGAGR